MCLISAVDSHSDILGTKCPTRKMDMEKNTIQINLLDILGKLIHKFFK